MSYSDPSPVSVDDNLVDAWFVNGRGELIEVPVIVPEHIQEQGHESVDDFIREYVSSLYGLTSHIQVEYTQTW